MTQANASAPAVPRATRGFARAAALVLAGTILGSAVAMTIALRRGLSATANPTFSQRSNTSDEAALRALQQRLALLETRSLADSSPTSESPIPPQPPPPETDANADTRVLYTPEERREQFWQNVAESLTAHEAEPLDRNWATVTADFFRQDLEQLGKLKAFKLDSLDCRSRTCVARLSWASADQARAGWRDVLHQPYSANCAKSVVLNEETDRSGTQGAIVHFDCETWRREGSQPVDYSKPRP